MALSGYAIARIPACASTRTSPVPGSPEYELARSLRHTHFFSLLVVRPDAPPGKAGLERLAATIAGHMRGTDVASRRGEADFWLILPETPSDAARVVGERIRLALGAEQLGGSVSIGIACFPEDGVSARELAAAVQRALAHAVELGGNRTVLHSVRGDAPPGWGLRRDVA